MSESSLELERAIHVPLPPSVSSLKISDVVRSFVQEQEEHELQDLESVTDPVSSGEHLPRRNISELAPVDGGVKAWSFLTAAFIVEAVVWAFPNSFGVLLSAYLNETELTSQQNASDILPLIGPLSSGFMYCSGPFIYPLLHRYPKMRRYCIYVGVIISVASLFGASYATKVQDLLILQGLLYGIGGSLLYDTCISYLLEWFVRKRGLANGVMFAGTSVGGLLLPIVMPILVNAYGPSKTLRILSVAILLLILPGIPFLRPRLPENRAYAPQSRSAIDDSSFKSWIRNPTFIFSMLANLLQGLAYFLPVLWLPTFASELHLSNIQSSLVVALLNGASVLSRIGMGTLADRFSPWILALLTTLCTSLATFVLWGVLSRDFAGVLVYGISYGVLAGGWSSLFSGFITSLAKHDPAHSTAHSTTLFGLFSLTRGIGNILSTPISTALSDMNSMSVAGGSFSNSTQSSADPSLGFDVAGGRYANMIVYVGTCFAASGVIAIFGLGFDVYKARRRQS